MMRGLSAISDTAFDMLIPSYDNVLNELEVRMGAWDEAERKALKEDESKQEDHDEEVEMEAVKTNPYKTLIGHCSVGYISYRSSASTRESMI